MLTIRISPHKESKRQQKPEQKLTNKICPAQFSFNIFCQRDAVKVCQRLASKFWIAAGFWAFSAPCILQVPKCLSASCKSTCPEPFAFQSVETIATDKFIVWKQKRSSSKPNQYEWNKSTKIDQSQSKLEEEKDRSIVGEENNTL